MIELLTIFPAALLSALCLFMFTTAITPGPNNILLMTSGVNFGLKRSLPLLGGICVGFPLMVAAIGLGLSDLFQRYPQLHQGIKIAGIGYLLYLAWALARSYTDLELKQDLKPLTALQAALFQWLNPKAWVMAIGVIATFTQTEQPLIPQVIVITALFCFFNLSTGLVWLGLGLAVKRWLNDPKRQRLFNYGMAGLLALSVIPML